MRKMGSVPVYQLLLLWAAACFGQADYPSRYVRFIVPYAPGGSSDVLARTLGQKLGEALGQTFAVDNRPGAGSMIGTDVPRRRPPDGYTIILSDMPHTINPSIYAKVPYDPVEGLRADHHGRRVADVSVRESVVQGPRNQRIRRACESAARPAGDRFGRHRRDDASAAGVAASHAGIKLTHVPYKGAGPAIADVVAGQIPATFTSMATAAPCQSGRLRILGVTSASASPRFPSADFRGKRRPRHDCRALVGRRWRRWHANTCRGKIARRDRECGEFARRARTLHRARGGAAHQHACQFRALLESDLRRWAEVVSNAGIEARVGSGRIFSRYAIAAEGRPEPQASQRAALCARKAFRIWHGKLDAGRVCGLAAARIRLTLKDGDELVCNPLLGSQSTEGFEAQVIDLGRGTPEDFERRPAKIAGTSCWCATSIRSACTRPSAAQACLGDGVRRGGLHHRQSRARRGTGVRLVRARGKAGIPAVATDFESAARGSRTAHPQGHRRRLCGADLRAGPRPAWAPIDAWC